jgi:hypothetical protein
VVDEGGEPLRVYHGTDATFDEFKPGVDNRNYGPSGFYFTPDRSYAQGYGEHVKEAHLRIENPAKPDMPVPKGFVQEIQEAFGRELFKDNRPITDKTFGDLGEAIDFISVAGGPEEQDALRKEITRALEKRGFDGYDAREFGDEIVAFRPDQIRTLEQRISSTADLLGPEAAARAMEGGASRLVKGAVTFDEAGKAFIELFRDADFSTLVHETGHILRRTLQGADLSIAEAWAGVKDGVWTREAEEKFSRAFEQYLTEGKAPTRELEGVFAKVKGWMLDVYRALKGTGAEVNDEIRGVFDRLLSTEDERVSHPATERPDGIPHEVERARPGAAEEVKAEALDILPEEAEALQRAREDGRLTPEEIAMVDRAEEVKTAADNYQEALLAAINCQY